MVLQQEVDIKFSCSSVLPYNMPTVSWPTRMSNKSQPCTAGRLLRGMAEIQRASQTGPLTVSYIYGVENSMAGVGYRIFGQNCVPDTFPSLILLPLYI